jgi:uncharacterized surface protein with fasciclin (FAS1) repeats
MRYLSILSLLGCAAAFVIPDPDQLAAVTTDREVAWLPDDQHRADSPLDLALDKGLGGSRILHHVRQRAEDVVDRVTSYWDEDDLESHPTQQTTFDEDDDSSTEHDYSSSDPSLDPFKHHDKPNRTIYQLITESKYTTKLAAIVSEDEELVKVLNGTKANYTLFAPTDSAFEKIPDHGNKPSKDFIKSLILLHVSDECYPAGRVLASHTIPTMLEVKKLGGRQRLAVKLGLKGLTVNVFSKVVAVNIFATNGVIHGIDTVLFMPPPTLCIIEATPSVFSTLALGLTKTNLIEDLKDVPHVGGTFFAPSNGAFAKLGAKANAFLFSKYGRKYLKALLEYHVVLNATLYSDAYYHTDEASFAALPQGGHGHNGHFHLDLPTQLEDRSLAVDVARWGPFINIRVNGYTDVRYQDAIAQDGVIQVVSNVLIPPKKLSTGEFDHWDGSSELTEEDLMERLEPCVRDAEHENNKLVAQPSHESVNGDGIFAEWKEYL